MYAYFSGFLVGSLQNILDNILTSENRKKGFRSTFSQAICPRETNNLKTITPACTIQMIMIIPENQNTIIPKCYENIMCKWKKRKEQSDLLPPKITITTSTTVADGLYIYISS